MAELITVKQAVELSGYKDHHIRDLLRSKRIKGKKWGNTWQVDKSVPTPLYPRRSEVGKQKRAQSQRFDFSGNGFIIPM